MEGHPVSTRLHPRHGLHRNMDLARHQKHTLGLSWVLPDGPVFLEREFRDCSGFEGPSNALHARGMYLMVDVVTNHFGPSKSLPNLPWSSYNPFNSEDYFHPHCAMDYDIQTSAEQCWLYSNLPDLRTEDPNVVDAYNTWITQLVSNYSIDGLRIDSVKDVNKSLMQHFCSAAGVYCMGELSNNDPAYAYPYQSILNGGGGIINYPMYFAFNETLAYPSSATLADLAYNIYGCKTNRTDSTLQGTFTENHDNPRIASHNPDLSLAANAIVWTFLTDGIPIIYQGQEQYLTGADDPFCREAMWLEENGSYNTSAPLHRTVAYVNQIFHWAAADNSPGYSTYKNWVQPYSDTQIQMRKDVVRTILTNAAQGQGSGTFTTQQAGFAAG